MCRHVQLYDMIYWSLWWFLALAFTPPHRTHVLCMRKSVERREKYKDAVALSHNSPGYLLTNSLGLLLLLFFFFHWRPT